MYPFKPFCAKIKKHFKAKLFIGGVIIFAQQQHLLHFASGMTVFPPHSFSREVSTNVGLHMKIYEILI